MRRNFWARKIAGMIVLAGIAVVLLGFGVMLLWNSILVAVLHIQAVTFGQALGILLLSKILFGRLGGGPGWKGRQEWKNKMKEKWSNMSTEEKEKFKAEWQSRCTAWNKKEQL